MRTVCFFFRRISVVFSTFMNLIYERKVGQAFFSNYNDTSNQIKKVITTYPIINFSYSRYENHRNHFDANQKNALKMLQENSYLVFESSMSNISKFKNLKRLLI